MTSVVFPHVKATERIPRVVPAHAVLEVRLFAGIIALTSTAPMLPVPMQLVGKRTARLLTAASDLAFKAGRMFVVMDRISGLRFLVDRGAEVSVLPASKEDRTSKQRGPTLRAANSTSIITYYDVTTEQERHLRRNRRRLLLTSESFNPDLPEGSKDEAKCRRAEEGPMTLPLPSDMAPSTGIDASPILRSLLQRKPPKSLAYKENPIQVP
ncbi:hypothetical protein HPB50_014313 [Hyalomma asiaticum]|uniref:Uncharacterized protein n=1 Tax=Hyalomma asiaticum TaxID=266040 RepID=A0ACB7S2M0_HYAAI|nr:hypothetical protein HPB50_014313 [Hyalomma asiaticum]